VLRQHGAAAVEFDDEMTTFARRKRRAFLGEIALGLAAVHGATQVLSSRESTQMLR
jgi:hypothetical protein